MVGIQAGAPVDFRTLFSHSILHLLGYRHTRVFTTVPYLIVEKTERINVQ